MANAVEIRGSFSIGLTVLATVSPFVGIQFAGNGLLTVVKRRSFRRNEIRKLGETSSLEDPFRITRICIELL